MALKILSIPQISKNETAVQVAVAHTLECKACVPHTYVCDKAVSARGLHGLACRRSGPRHQRHSQPNDILWRAFKKAPVPAVKEPPGLSRDDGKRPDGSRCCHGQKANRWHGMSQYQTPMPTHTSLTRRPRLGRQQLTRLLLTRKPNTGSWPTAIFCISCHRDSRDLEQPSSGIGGAAGPTNDSRH